MVLHKHNQRRRSLSKVPGSSNSKTVNYSKAITNIQCKSMVSPISLSRGNNCVIFTLFICVNLTNGIGHIRVEEAINDDAQHIGIVRMGMAPGHRSSANLQVMYRTQDDLSSHLHSGSEQHAVFSDDGGAAPHNTHFGEYPSDEQNQRYNTARHHYNTGGGNNDPISQLANFTMEEKKMILEKRRNQMIIGNTTGYKGGTKG